MKIEATKTFIKLYKDLPTEIQILTKKALGFLEKNIHHPSLGNKKMSGHNDIYEIRVNINYRITYNKINDLIILRKIGTHNLLRNP